MYLWVSCHEHTHMGCNTLKIPFFKIVQIWFLESTLWALSIEKNNNKFWEIKFNISLETYWCVHAVAFNFCEVWLLAKEFWIHIPFERSFEKLYEKRRNPPLFPLPLSHCQAGSACHHPPPATVSLCCSVLNPPDRSRSHSHGLLLSPLLTPFEQHPSPLLLAFRPYSHSRSLLERAATAGNAAKERRDFCRVQPADLSLLHLRSSRWWAPLLSRILLVFFSHETGHSSVPTTELRRAPWPPSMARAAWGLPWSRQVPTSSPCRPLPPCALGLVNRGLESQLRELRQAVHGAAINLRGNHLPDRVYGWERTRIAFLSPLVFSKSKNRAP